MMRAGSYVDDFTRRIVGAGRVCGVMAISIYVVQWQYGSRHRVGLGSCCLLGVNSVLDIISAVRSAVRWCFGYRERVPFFARGPWSCLYTTVRNKDR